VRKFRRIPLEEDTPMMKRLLTVSLCLFALTLSGFAQMKKSPMKKPAGPAPDKAYLQKIWDGWSTLDPANVAKFYAPGPDTFFDIAPLKYSSWEDYAKGVQGLAASYKSAKFTLNDDVAIHPHADVVWVSATVKEEKPQRPAKSRWEIFAGPPSSKT
jgi:hypothetical protein